MIALMIAGSQLLHTTIAIFPEAAALSLGTLTLQKQAWKRSRPKIVILPTVASTLGVLLVSFGVPTLIGAPLLLVLIVIALYLLDSELLPTISAGVLPIVFRISSPWFILTVAIVVGSIALASLFMDKLGGPKPHQASTSTENGPEVRRKPAPVALYRFLVVVVPWIFLAHALLPLPAIAPPLLVSIYEWYSRNQRRVADGLKRWVVMLLAVSLGEITTHVGLGVLAVVIAETVLLALMAGIDSIDPPAMAVLLLPWIARSVSPMDFIFAIGTAALVLYGLGVELPLWNDATIVRLVDRAKGR
jgi:hypothetical protein